MPKQIPLERLTPSELTKKFPHTAVKRGNVKYLNLALLP